MRLHITALFGRGWKQVVRVAHLHLSFHLQLLCSLCNICSLFSGGNFLFWLVLVDWELTQRKSLNSWPHLRCVLQTTYLILKEIYNS